MKCLEAVCCVRNEMLQVHYYAKYLCEHSQAKVDRVGSITLLQQVWSKQVREGDQQQGKIFEELA